MYKVLQIPQLLTNNFNDYAIYLEYQIPSFKTMIDCIWVSTTFMPINQPIVNYILPDGCIDLIFDFESKQIFFSGMSKATHPFAINNKIKMVGIRFKPGVFHYLYHRDASIIMDHHVPYHELETQDLFKIFSINYIKDLLNYIETFLTTKKSMLDNSLIDKIFQIMQYDLSNLAINTLQNELSLSQRQIQRLFLSIFGVSPKTLLNILRLNLSLKTIINQPYLSMTEIALQCSFYDQSHFNREIKRYCGYSPKELQQLYVQNIQDLK